MKTRNLKLAVIASIFYMGETSYSQDAPKVNEIRIEKVTTSGKGCPKDSVSITVLNRDNDPSGRADYFVVGYEKFGVSWPGGLKSNFCNIAVDMAVKEGYALAFLDVKTEGMAYIPEGMNGQITSDINFLNKKSSANKKLPSEFNDEFSDFKTTFNKKVWSPCDETKTLKIAIKIELNNKPKDSSEVGNIDVMSTSGSTKSKQQFSLGWKSCD